MKNLNMPSLINQVEKEEQTKKDFLVDTKSILIGTENNVSCISIPEGRYRKTFVLNDTARQQMAARLNIPLPFAERLRTEEPALFDRTFNTLLHRKSEQRLMRTSGGDTCRAYLSQNYKILDNDEFLRTVLPILSLNPNIMLQEAFLSGTHLQLSLTVEENDKYIRPGDAVKYGVVLINSEVGLASLSLSSFIYRLLCSNGLILPECNGTLRRIHLGKAASDINGSMGDRSIWREYSSAIRELVEGKRFDEIIVSMREAASNPLMKNTETLVEYIGKRFNLSKEEKAIITTQYEANADSSLWGLVNAVTETAKEAATIPRRNDLQAIGGRLLTESHMLSAMAA